MIFHRQEVMLENVEIGLKSCSICLKIHNDDLPLHIFLSGEIPCDYQVIAPFRALRS